MLLHHKFIETAKRHGKKLAFVDCNTDRRITYQRALTGALMLSRKFSSFDEGFLGIMLPTSAGGALSIIAALMSGRVPVMINYSTGAVQNAEFARRRCDFKTIVTSRALLQKINCPEVEGMVYIEDIMAGVSIADKLRAALFSKLPLFMILERTYKGEDHDNAVILFTSGSEKEPKAVQLTHRNIISDIESFSEIVELSEKDSMLASLPFFHVLGLTINLWAPIYHGMTIITYANPLDFKRICDIARGEQPTIMVGTPSFLWGYLRRSEEGDFKSIRLAVSGADKCPDALREAFLKKHGITLYEGYGTTETSPVISVNTPENNRPGSVGKVLPGMDVRIENYETGEECSPGEVGRILVRGDIVMKGYLDNFEETSMRIHHGWYDTGDMGHFDTDGYLWHAGRLKRFVKIGGEMASLVKVEDVLEKFLPEGVSCCVVEVPDAMKGARVVAAVTAKVDEKAILKKMSEELPNIALPRRFVVFGDLPKMGSGKIDFRSVTDIVQEMLHAQAPGP